MGAPLYAFQACRDSDLVQSDAAGRTGFQQPAGEPQFHTLHVTLNHRFTPLQERQMGFRPAEFIEQETVAALVYAEDGAGSNRPAAWYGRAKKLVIFFKFLKNRYNSISTG